MMPVSWKRDGFCMKRWNQFFLRLEVMFTRSSAPAPVEFLPLKLWQATQLNPLGPIML